MAGSVNKVILLGNVGRDPEIRTFQNGDRVVSFSLATTESWRDKASGERKTATQWHNVQIFNDAVGKIAEQYVRKGDKVFIEGQLTHRQYVDKNGEKRFATDVTLPRFGGSLCLLSNGERNGASSGQSNDAPPPSGPLSTQIDDEIPF